MYRHQFVLMMSCPKSRYNHLVKCLCIRVFMYECIHAFMYSSIHVLMHHAIRFPLIHLSINAFVDIPPPCWLKYCVIPCTCFRAFASVRSTILPRREVDHHLSSRPNGPHDPQHFFVAAIFLFLISRILQTQPRILVKWAPNSCKVAPEFL